MSEIISFDYDTPFDHTPDEMDMELFFNTLLRPFKHNPQPVGFVITGSRALRMADGYWGNALRLNDTENIQVRHYPRERIGLPLEEGETRMIATRVSGNGAFRVTVAILFLPTLASSFKYNYDVEDESSKTPLRTIGCRGVHILLPSLMDKHFPHREKVKGSETLDLSGYFSIRSSCTMIRQTRNGTVGTMAMRGTAYLCIAASICGTEYKDQSARAACVKSERNHMKTVADAQMRLGGFTDDETAAGAIAAALRVVDFLGAEGILSMTHNPFFEGALPDTMHSPAGFMLIIVMAVRIACFPERFFIRKADGCTIQDAYANVEFCNTVNSRWRPISSNGFLAIDVVCDSALRHAKEKFISEEGERNSSDTLGNVFHDNMVFWHRTGQRLVSNCMASPAFRALVECRAAKHKIGDHELVLDPLSQAKYGVLGREGKVHPFNEACMSRFMLASKADVKTKLIQMHDNVEEWLRTGMYNGVRLSEKNVNVPRMPKKMQRLNGNVPLASKGPSCGYDTAPEDEAHLGSEEEDVDDIMDNQVCLDAVTTATGIVHSAMSHASFATHQFGVQTLLVSKKSKTVCADCDKDVDALHGALFNSQFSECPSCNRHRCYRCAQKAAKMNRRTGNCLRCQTV